MHPRLVALERNLAPLEITSLHSDLLQQRGIQVDVLRADAIHPHISGNKWYKLKYNLEHCLSLEHEHILTFGGAWSNHIHATAAACEALGLRSIGIIRGETVDNTNLAFARDRGMQLDFVSRQDYRRKHETVFIDELRARYGEFYLLPEGGSNRRALRGIGEMIAPFQQDYDAIITAAGTGATLAGLIQAAGKDVQVTAYAVLKDQGSLELATRELLCEDYDGWRIDHDYHFGGYARTNASLFEFMHMFEQDFGFALDAVYTAKMFYGLFDAIAQGKYTEGTRLLALHSGGLQGNAGFTRTR